MKKLSDLRFPCAVIVIGSAILIAALPVGAQSTEGMVAPHRHGPASIRHLHSDGTAESDNWAGYAIAAATPPTTPTSPTGVTVTSVTASWVVPEVSKDWCQSSPNSESSFWVGIDGWYSPTVEQIGTDSDCSNGTPTYYAWYEFYPLDSYYACAAASSSCKLMTLAPGDLMVATVNCNTDGTCTATITDESINPPNNSFSTTFTPTKQTGTPQLSSGEWIAETPCCTKAGDYLRLADFGTISYGQDYCGVLRGTDTPVCVAGTGKVTNYATVITSAALTAPINSFFSIGPATWWACTMVNEKYPIPDDGVNPPAQPPKKYLMAVPSGLSPDGSSFQVTFKHRGP